MEWKYTGKVNKLHIVVEKTQYLSVDITKRRVKCHELLLMNGGDSAVEFCEYGDYLLSPNPPAYLSWQGNHASVQQFLVLCLYLAKLYLQCRKQSHLHYDIKWTDGRVKSWVELAKKMTVYASG